MECLVVKNKGTWRRWKKKKITFKAIFVVVAPSVMGCHSSFLQLDKLGKALDSRWWSGIVGNSWGLVHRRKKNIPVMWPKVCSYVEGMLLTWAENVSVLQFTYLFNLILMQMSLTQLKYCLMFRMLHVFLIKSDGRLTLCSQRRTKKRAMVP